MKRLLFLFLICGNIAFGYTYNDLLLKAQTAIFPKLLLLDKQLNDKLVNGKIVYTIVYRENDYNKALEVRDLVDAYYKKNLDQYGFEITLVEYSDVSDNMNATAVYALNSDEGIDKLAKLATSKGIITFAYDIAALKDGMLFSMVVEKTTVIYLNKKILQRYNVDFVDSLYQIVRFF